MVAKLAVFEWCMVRWDLRTDMKKTCVQKRIRLCAQNLLIILGLTVNII